MDKTIGISEFRQTIADRIKDVHEHRCRYIIVQRSTARAVLISPDELELLEGKANKKNQITHKQAKSVAPRPNKTSYDAFFGKRHLSGKRSL